MGIRWFDYTALTIIIVGAINWGLIMAFQDYLCTGRNCRFIFNYAIW